MSCASILRDLPDNLRRDMTGRLALKAAVADGLRTFSPYRYHPDLHYVHHDQQRLLRSLRETLNSELFDQAWLDGPGASCDLSTLLEQSTSESSDYNGGAAHCYSQIAVSLRPQDASCWIALSAAQIRNKNLYEAEKSLNIAERVAESDQERSRALANRAFIAELFGNIGEAFRLAARAVAVSDACPLAIANYRTYHFMSTSGRQE